MIRRITTMAAMMTTRGSSDEVDIGKTWDAE